MIKHVKNWNIWRKLNANRKMYKLMVLLGLTKSPSLESVRIDCEIMSGFLDDIR